MFQCLIVDDEPLAVKLLADYVEKHEDTTLAGIFTNPIAAIKALDDLTVDLLLLDIQMPELTGIQMAKIVQGKYPVIFTTAYEHYALEGYELDVIDYLLKPISFDRFAQAIQRAKQRIQPITIEQSAENTITALFVKSGYKTVRLGLDAIVYMEGLGDYIRIHTREGSIMTLEKMKYFEEVLPSNAFVRVHKSYLVALDKIEYIERNHIVIGKQRIPIGATYTEGFWERIKEA
ncbi:MAG TPA: response regulator transcription factor [Saprospiraceae bacterium]|nr:response regulator transcription factor [Saprospiraceae bacterium]HMQ85557.1 response regulator transcription factor [Saprospiraceae bacterium]